jgi:hypothetical protein
LRTSPVALLAGEFMESLSAGKRLLIVDEVQPKLERPWLDQLRRFGVPVLRERERETVEIGRPYGLKVSFVEGQAVEVFTTVYSRRPLSYLLVHHAELGSSTSKVRRLRAEAAKQLLPDIQRLCLLPTGANPRPGLMAQFGCNTGGILATETLKILRAEADALVVERPSGLQALVPREQWEALAIYQPVPMALTPGDRIRLTRNNGFNPKKTGLRDGRHFIVRTVDDDGTAHLNGGRTLPPVAGHWDYDFCVPVEDGPPASPCQVVCEVDDLPLLALHGWLKRKGKVVVCAASREQAEQALRLAMKGRCGDRCLPGTDQIGYALGMALSPAPKLAKPQMQPAAPPVAVSSEWIEDEDSKLEADIPPTTPDLEI